MKYIIQLQHHATTSTLIVEEFGIAFRLARFGFTGHCKARQKGKVNYIDVDHHVSIEEAQEVINRELNPEAIELKLYTEQADN